MLRSGEPWLRVTTTDQVAVGVLTERVQGLQDPHESHTGALL